MTNREQDLGYQLSTVNPDLRLDIDTLINKIGLPERIAVRIAQTGAIPARDSNLAFLRRLEG